MGMDPGVLSARLARESGFASGYRKPQAADRRMDGRRTADRQRATLAALASWFANRQVQPLIVVDARMNILVANTAGEELLPRIRGIVASGTRLAFLNSRHRAELERVVDEQTNCVSFPMKAGRATVELGFSPIALPGLGRVFMLNIQASDSGGINCEHLQSECGLTEAESHVALSIFRGLSLVEIAKERSASINTVKTQARHIFQKCRVHSQAGLTRRIGELMSSRLTGI